MDCERTDCGQKVQRPAIIGTCPTAIVEVEGVKVPCVLDTGSQVTLFSETFFQKWFGHIHPCDSSDLQWLTLKAANGLQIPYTGYVILDFVIGGVRILNKGVVIVKDECMGSERGILGMNVISQCWKALFQGDHPGMTAFASISPEDQGAWEKAFTKCRQIEEAPPDGKVGVARLTKQDPVEVPAHTEMVLWAQVLETSKPTHSCVLVEGISDEEQWHVAKTLAIIKNGKVPIRIKNVNPFPIVVPQRRPLASVYQVFPSDVHGEKELVLHTDQPGMVEVDVQNVQLLPEAEHPVFSLKGEGLTANEQQQMDQLLRKWSKVFAAHEEDYGRTDAVQHHIPTGVAPPSRERYRPVPPSIFPELRRLLQSMLESGVVSESSSPWAAPIVLVKKKDGTWRFCVDYRKLNGLTHKDAFPLPRIEESLTCLKQSRWFSTLDLASGYWQVEVDPQDRKKTAFTTPLGLYEFQRMPFGLCNAPATFQRLMQRCLGSMVNDTLLIYLDDIIIFSPDFQSHLQHLEQVFDKLWRHGLKLQPHKCSLFQPKVNYLGHVVSKEGVATDPEKTIAVQRWKPPTTVREVRSFLGLAGYYRRFIPGFSRVAAPLHALTTGTATQKDRPVQWTEGCQVAFDKLKRALVSPPVLAYADFSRPFHLYTDASLDGLGAVLSQVQEGRERVIAYASRSLLPTERNDKNYSSFKLELLALKWAVTEKFKDYLWGVKFTAFTDNNPLVHLKTATLGAVEQRWAAQLANFDFDVKYRPGVTNKNADVLSRFPQEEETKACPVMAEGAEEAEAPESEWAERQQEDPALQEVRAWLQRGRLPTTEDRSAARPAAKRLLRDWSRLRLEEGVLQRKVREQHTGDVLWQIVLPPAWTHKVWKQYHQNMGHMGAARTEAALRRGFFWPNLGPEVREWSAGCPQCVQRKNLPVVKAPLVPIECSYPLEIIAMDYLSLGRKGDYYQHILVMTDLFSRHSWAVPTRDQTAVTTAKALWRTVIQTWGCPEKILSDRGATFESTVVAELCQLYGCTKLRTTPYHPQGNGACERFNQTVLSLLRLLEEDDHPRWPDKLPALLQAYNNSEHSCTGLTPHFVLHGRHARLPVEMATGAPHTRTRYDMDGWVRSHHQTLLSAYQRVAAMTQQRQQRDKARYDSRIKHVPLLPGERVLLRNFRRHDQGKLAPHWQPIPYVVVCQMRPHQPVYKIRREGRDGPERTVHRNNIRPCPADAQWPPPPATAPNSSRPQNGDGFPVTLPYIMVPVTPVGPAARGPEQRAPAPEAGPRVSGSEQQAVGPVVRPEVPGQQAAAPPPANSVASEEQDQQGLELGEQVLLRRSTRETRGKQPVRYSN